MRIRNAKRLVLSKPSFFTFTCFNNCIILQDKVNYAEDKFAGSDDEIDPYKETVVQEGKDKEAAEESEETDSEDGET